MLQAGSTASASKKSDELHAYINEEAKRIICDN